MGAQREGSGGGRHWRELCRRQILLRHEARGPERGRGPLYTMSYIGVNGGMVLGVADDPGMHSSQNEQDSRRHAIGAKVPMLEPADSQECKDFTKLAYALSEEFDTPVVPAADHQDRPFQKPGGAAGQGRKRFEAL